MFPKNLKNIKPIIFQIKVELKINTLAKNIYVHFLYSFLNY